MTYEKLYNFLKIKQREMMRNREFYIETAIVANEKAIEAVEKQIPKKTIKYIQLSTCDKKQILLNDYDSERCPACGSDIWETITQKARCCQNCGQRLER